MHEVHGILSQDNSLANTLKNLRQVIHIPWDKASTIGVRIQFDKLIEVDDGYLASDRELSKPLIVEGRKRGEISIAYLASSDKALSFDDEENVLLESIAHALAQHIERIEAQRALRNQEHHYRRLFSLAQQGIWLLDDQLQTLQVNQALCRMLGYEENEFSQTSLCDHVAPESKRLCESHFLDNPHAEIEQCELSLRNKAGQKRTFAVEASRIQEEGTDGMQLLLGLVDITERKDTEETLRVLACAFQTHESILIAQSDGRIMRVNNAFTEITGYREDEVIGKNPRLLKSGKHDANFYQKMWSKLLDEGKWSGEIWNRRKDGELILCWQTITAVRNPNGKTQHYVSVFMDITQRRRDQDWILHQANYDPLTDLPNRRYFRAQLDEFLKYATANESYGAIMFMDLDHFKSINESMGHHVGDRVLKFVGQRLIQCLSKHDIIARLGGDEFVILLKDLGQLRGAAETATRHKAEKILQAFRAPFEVDGEAFTVGCSIGTTLAPNGNATAHELLIQADAAMYHAKKMGKHVSCEYTPEIRRASDERALLEYRLKQALESNSLTLYYQPQFDDKHRLIGAEALMRWLEDGSRIISPPEIVKLAEQAHLTQELGNWVIRQACKDLRAWQQRGMPASFEKLSVNISPRQFTAAQFAQSTLAIVHQHEINPEQLTLEVTEEALIEDIEAVITTMMKLRSEGLRFALDDFGTGFSPLYYLSRLPLSTLKIDQSFVRNLDNIRNTGIVSSIIALGHKLGFDLIAEGVETREQLNKLRSFGCRRFQGYLFSKPISCHDFMRLMSAHTHDSPSTDR